MSASIIAAFVVPLVLALLAWWLDHLVTSEQSNAARVENLFKVAGWVHGIFVACGGVCGMFLFWSMEETKAPSSQMMMMMIGIIGVVISIAAHLWYANSIILLTDKELIIEDPFFRKVVRFDQIKDVRVAGGMIVVDEGKIPRVVIPIIYRKTGLLLANIDARRMKDLQLPQSDSGR